MSSFCKNSTFDLKIVLHGELCKGFVAGFYVGAGFICRKVVEFSVFIIGMNIRAAQN